ncbi:MAG: Serine/threonine-protein phosphatase pp1 [Chaenotheca gracillima]|nr:MAG: Serine/threonine-protein phosphatase pp1 [Chaenotheca gracillima]
MAGNGSAVILLAFALIAATIFLLGRFLSTGQDGREPPLIPPKIPVVGHLIGLMRSQMFYYVKLRNKNPLPIYTLSMGGAKVYIVSSPEIIAAIQRHPKTLSFATVAASFSARICSTSQAGQDILNRNVNGEEGEWGLSPEIYKNIHAALAPGPGINGMTRVMIQYVAESLGKLEGKTTRINLMQWLRHEITMATTNAVYGPKNPFVDPEIENGFWDFESSMGMLLVNVMPRLTARKGFAGRAKVMNAFRDYFAEKGHEGGSQLIKNRYMTNSTNGLSLEDTAGFEVGGAIAILVNTTPAAFWMIFFAFSQPELLADLRREAAEVVVTNVDENGAPRRSIDVEKIRSNCPLMVSMFQENLRVRATGASVRTVTEDTVINNQYLLKKGGLIQMPSQLPHSDPSLWGPSVTDFDPRRFLKGADAKPTTTTDKKRHPQSFRAFGGGSSLCPGRQFATTEILAILTMFILRYEMEPVSGSWTTPQHDKSNVTAAVMSPNDDVAVDVSPRKGYEGGSWTFGLGDSGMTFSIATEDQREG